MRNNIPESIDDLFINREATYEMYTTESLDNNNSMSLFIDELELHDFITENYGTQIKLRHSDFPFTMQIDAGGLGDFYSHKFDVSIEYDEEIDEETLYQ